MAEPNVERIQMKKLAFVAAAGAVAFAGGAQADTLSDTIARGALNCGVNIGVPGFAEQADDGSWSGLDVDVCRAVSAAIFGDADMVEYFPVNSSERFNRLNSGDYDLLSRNTTWTFSRDVDLGLS
ncbi:MAG: transporter substrate-binding domain-containing protein, partial [Pseudomonadota bacterium]|nr:transporter substrate-binding domain-containing protein [Pseudomonadota bacterium]